MPRPENQAARLSSMGRGLEVLSALARRTGGDEETTVNALAGDLGRERSQVSRTVSALTRSGLARRHPARGVALDWRWYAEAQELTERRLHTHGGAVLETLSAELGEAAFLGVLQGDSTITILESLPARTRMIGSWIGRSYPAYCSDAGRAVLWDADDDEIRAIFARTAFRAQGPRSPRSVDELLGRLQDDRVRGYTVVDEEAEQGLYSVAAPVRDFRGEVIAAVQVVGERETMVARSKECGEACARAAAELSLRLGASDPAGAAAGATADGTAVSDDPRSR